MSPPTTADQAQSLRQIAGKRLKRDPDVRRSEQRPTDSAGQLSNVAKAHEQKFGSRAPGGSFGHEPGSGECRLLRRQPALGMAGLGHGGELTRGERASA
jgi:hypothetical protein